MDLYVFGARRGLLQPAAGSAAAEVQTAVLAQLQIWRPGVSALGTELLSGGTGAVSDALPQIYGGTG